ncbi:type II toxin-antitoxin system VapC family toxin [Candidatus Poriferisocius sp.]|uniref:type II toxin-antitoxin system VapC family toxin n=1 Tax=Candidatus Poriferisocius sp. TaxID=3101276 RepID=UPI003B01B81B
MKFADTSWWVAWAVSDDPRHHDAEAMLSQVGDAEQLLTTNFIMGEAWTFLRSRHGHQVAVPFLDEIELAQMNSKLVVHQVSPEQEFRAWTWLRRHDERAYSFVDSTSFIVMRDRRLREALAFDQDFAAAGFIELRP